MQQHQNEVETLKHLISRVRSARGVVAGVTPQPDNADYGMIGQTYENFIYFGEDHPISQEALADNGVVNTLLQIAKRELLNPEAFR